MYDRKCYGYTHDENGHLVIDSAQAAVVCLIFDLYLSGYSIVKIIRELEHRGIPSPTGKETWCKRSIDTILTNSKYTGNAVALKSTTEGYEKKNGLYLKPCTVLKMITRPLFPQRILWQYKMNVPAAVM